MSTQEAFLAEKVEKFMRDNIDDQHSAKLMNALVEFGCDCFDFYKAHNDTVIAELVEALKLARPSIHLSCAKHKIETVIEKQDYLKTLYEYDKKLLDKIEELIAKHKGQS